MSWADEGRVLRATPPAPDGLARLADALGEPVAAERPLHGGVAASAFALATPARRLVLKRYRAGDETAPLEWERLHLAVAVPVPTPEPVAFDPDGAWFGMPALVMTFLEGAAMYPPDPEALGHTLAALHATPVPDPVPPVLQRPPLWAKWTANVPYPPGVVGAIRELQAIAGAEPTVLCHCDFHPGNVLAAGGEVTGVVDWSSARLAARGFDVALTRCDLAIDPGGDAPARFLAAYEAAACEVAYLPLWDVLAAARAIEWGDGWVEAWTEVGVPMTAARVRERATAFAAAALSHRS